MEMAKTRTGRLQEPTNPVPAFVPTQQQTDVELRSISCQRYHQRQPSVCAGLDKHVCTVVPDTKPRYPACCVAFDSKWHNRQSTNNERCQDEKHCMALFLLCSPGIWGPCRPYKSRDLGYSTRRKPHASNYQERIRHRYVVCPTLSGARQ